MKRLLSALLVLTLALSLTACSGKPAATANIPGELPALMNQLMENVDLDAETKEWLKNGMMQTELTPENTEYYLGKGDYSYKSGLAAEPKMSSQAFSVVLVRAEDAAAAQKLSEGVKTTVDPRKWICVGIDDPANVKTASHGDLMILVMAENAQKYMDAFAGLAK
ncbi:MAG: hypothetical protein RSC76_04980 [Oscillospiraceae bacterium]